MNDSILYHQEAGAATDRTTSGHGGDSSRRRRLARASGANQPTPTTGAQVVGSSSQQQQIQTLTGQRLIIPCRNSSRSPLLATGSENQTRRAGGAGQPPAARSRLPPASSGGLGAAQFPAMNGIALIVWHKDDQLNSPIFAVDARGGSIRDAKQQAISDSLKGRARVQLVEQPPAGSMGASGPVPGSGPPALVIEEARLDDSGLYTCTVEFDRAPTQTYQATVGVSGEYEF